MFVDHRLDSQPSERGLGAVDVEEQQAEGDRAAPRAHPGRVCRLLRDHQTAWPGGRNVVQVRGEWGDVVQVRAEFCVCVCVCMCVCACVCVKSGFAFVHACVLVCTCDL